MSPQVTSPESARTRRDAIREMSGRQRMELGCVMADLARAAAIAEIQLRAPTLSADEARHVVLREALGAELHRAAFPAWNAALSAFEASTPIGLDVRAVFEVAAREAEDALLPTR